MTDRETRLRYRAPLLRIAHIAVFRQISKAVARYLWSLGELPRSELADGALFTAQRLFVVPALAFRATLDEPTRKVFDAWQRGEVEIVEPRSETEQGVLPLLLKVSESVSTKPVKGC